MTTELLSPLPVLRFVDNNGNALTGGKLFTYAAGSTTKLATYTDNTGGTANTNPIILNSRGECNVWIPPGTPYKFVLSPSTDTDPPTNPIWTVDQITAGGTSVTSIADAINGGLNFSAASGVVLVSLKPSDLLVKSAPTAADSVLIMDAAAGNAAKTSPLSAIQASFIPRAYIAGFLFTNDGTTPNSVLDVAAGQCSDSTNTVIITLGAFTKSTAGAWVAGSGADGMGNGLSVAVSTTYHVFSIINGGNPDIYFDTSPIAANAPAGTTAYRRIGSFRTDSSAHILAFTALEIGGGAIKTYWSAVVTDLNGVTIGSIATLEAMTIPTGVKMGWIGRIVNQSSENMLVTSPDETDVAAPSNADTNPGFDVSTASNIPSILPVEITTNTSAQIRFRAQASTSTNVYAYTRGWTDFRRA